MTISHHSHSGQFCCHAKGTLAEVVEEAIDQGFTTFGLSEHVPRYSEEHFYPEESHLTVQDLMDTFEAYLVEAHRLKEEHAEKCDLLVGLETEYIDEDGLIRLEQLLEKHTGKIEYLVGSVHHCDAAPIDFDKERFDACHSSQPGDSDRARLEHLLGIYFDNQYKILSRLQPEVVGHFDLCRLYYPDTDFKAFPAVWARIERNIDFAVSYGALFEINASAFRKGWQTAYPGADVFDLIARKGGRFTLSDDSHGPQAVGLNYDRAYRYMSDRRLGALWRLERAHKGAAGAFRRGCRAVKVDGQPWLDQWPALLTRSRETRVRV
ncbi:hypothetical protein JCM10908_006101 [Rhodotorula pacifica]|uniref:histidinol-phosphatase n=1 Tax=Rhodotorula pacifica TaxID=1495444 RepID=UPI0031737F87